MERMKNIKANLQVAAHEAREGIQETVRDLGTGLEKLARGMKKVGRKGEAALKPPVAEVKKSLHK
jgi:hypothetical protein